MTLHIPSDWIGYLNKAGIIDLALETVCWIRFNLADCRLPIRDELAERQEIMLIFTCTVLWRRSLLKWIRLVHTVAAYICVVVYEA